VPASANPFLLTKVLRDEWARRFVVSDYTAVMELTHQRHRARCSDGDTQSADGRVDVDMMSHYYDTQLPGLIRSASPMSVVDEGGAPRAAREIATGLFERHLYGGDRSDGGGPSIGKTVRRRPKSRCVG